MSPLATLLLCWCALGLLVLADVQRARVAMPVVWGWRPPRPHPLLGSTLLAFAAWSLVRNMGAGLGASVFVLALMGVASVAVVVAGLRPRLYAVSVLVAGLAFTIALMAP